MGEHPRDGRSRGAFIHCIGNGGSGGRRGNANLAIARSNARSDAVVYMGFLMASANSDSQTWRLSRASVGCACNANSSDMSHQGVFVFVLATGRALGGGIGTNRLNCDALRNRNVSTSRTSTDGRAQARRIRSAIFIRRGWGLARGAVRTPRPHIDGQSPRAVGGSTAARDDARRNMLSIQIIKALLSSVGGSIEVDFGQCSGKRLIGVGTEGEFRACI